MLLPITSATRFSAGAGPTPRHSITTAHTMAATTRMVEPPRGCNRPDQSGTVLRQAEAPAGQARGMRTASANARAADLAPVIDDIRSTGATSLGTIAAAL